jgi:hypothetical protein
MAGPLQTYLADHLAGAVHAIELLSDLRQNHSSSATGDLAGKLLPEIEADKEVLEDLAKRVDASPSTIKNALSWAAEKLSRVKLRRGDEKDLGTFESLEYLALGIHGKLALWKALAVVAEQGDERLRGLDYNSLARRAREQHEAVETKRLELAPIALMATRS